jgi:DNA invertase Pin-like site-specific DNA recombinase
VALRGYARVSTEDQATLSQTDELRVAGCVEIHEEHASGGSRARPVLNRLLQSMKPGDVLVVVRLDRLARSLSHLLEVIETLEAKGAFFKSLHDPVDTTSPQGKFTLQVLGAAAELERALIRERTDAGLKAARAEGRVGGNPALKRKDPEAIRRVRDLRAKQYLAMLNVTSREWLPTVRRMRPDHPWEDVVRVLNANLPPGRKPWNVDKITRAARTYAREGFISKGILGRATNLAKDDRLLVLVAGIASAAPDLTLVDICIRLEALREPTPRGKRRWQPSSVKMLLDRAKERGYIDVEVPA